MDLSQRDKSSPGRLYVAINRDPLPAIVTLGPHVGSANLKSGSGAPGLWRADWRRSGDGIRHTAVRRTRKSFHGPLGPSLEAAEREFTVGPFRQEARFAGASSTRQILSPPISAARCASALLMDSENWFAVDVFEPKTTMPPNRAARPATIIIGSYVTTPRVVAAIRIPPRPMAAFAAKAVFRHRSSASASSSICSSSNDQ